MLGDTAMVGARPAYIGMFAVAELLATVGDGIRAENARRNPIFLEYQPNSRRFDSRPHRCNVVRQSLSVEAGEEDM